MAKKLSHVDSRGRATMVDVGAKDVTVREAVAVAELVMQPATLALITEGRAAKGDVLGVARIAGIQAAKRTSELIPLCHAIALTSVRVEIEPVDPSRGLLRITASARARDRTGVEMEALVAASVAALTVYDMVKAVDRSMVVREVRLEEKKGGRSGHWTRETPDR